MHIEQLPSYYYYRSNPSLTLPEHVSRIRISLEKGDTFSDGFFLPYIGLQELRIYGQQDIVLPSSLFQSKTLSHLELNIEKLTKIPEITRPQGVLYNLHIYKQKKLLFEQAFKSLSFFSDLKTFDWTDYGDKKFPKTLELMTQLDQLFIGADVLKKTNLTELIDSIATLKNLKAVRFDLPRNFQFPIEELLKLDFLEQISSSCFHFSKTIPLYYARMKNALLTSYIHASKYAYEDEIGFYQEKISDIDLTEAQRELLFGFLIENFTALKDKIENPFGKEKNGKSVFLHGKFKRERLKDIQTNLKKLGYELVKNVENATIQILTQQTKYETIKPLVLAHKTIALEAHLNDFLLANQEQYLLEEENLTLNDAILRLLTTNIEENLLLAFSIIEVGGANKIIQSMLAALYYAHPSTVIQKAVEPVFEKYVSASYRQHIKANGKSALRAYEMKASTYKRYAEHCDLDKEAFLLMYHLIASENPKIEDILPHTLKCNDLDLRCFTAIIQYFPHIEHIQLRRNPAFELEKSLPFLALLPNLKSLVLHENLWKIVNLSTLPTLQSFQVSRHQVENLEWINFMPNLKHLTIGRIKVDAADFSSIGDRFNKGK